MDDPTVQQLIQALIKNNVAISSTPAILEAQARGLADQRSLDAMDSFHAQAYQNRRKQMEAKGADWYFKDGKGYDPQKLITAIKGKVGSPMDDAWRAGDE